MIKFETLEAYVDILKKEDKANELIRKGFRMMENDSAFFTDTKSDYYMSQLFEESIGSEAFEILMLWLYDYDFGTKCPPESDDYETLPSDLSELYNDHLLPAIKNHIANI